MCTLACLYVISMSCFNRVLTLWPRGQLRPFKRRLLKNSKHHDRVNTNLSLLYIMTGWTQTCLYCTSWRGEHKPSRVSIVCVISGQDISNVFVECINSGTTKNKGENYLLKIKRKKRVKFSGKKSRYVISMHKYTVLKIQWLFIKKIRWAIFTSIH